MECRWGFNDKFSTKKGRFFKPKLVHCGVGQQRQLLVELPV